MAKRKRGSGAAQTDDVDVVVATGSAMVSTPEEARALIRRTSSRKKKSVVYTEDGSETEIGPSQKDDPFDGSLTDLDDEPAEVQKSPKKRKRRTKVTEPVVYNIPPVETKSTTFKGRLGYACLNTILRVLKPDPVFCSRTLRIDTILKPEFGMDYCKGLGRRNAEDLSRLIQWNEDNKIKFMRISSEMFPFASHDKYGYTIEYAQKELKAAGDLARKYGHRLTTHPGQFTQLGSPREVVVDAAIRDLDYHCQMFRHMELDQDSVMIIHMGGMFGDKAATIDRFREVYKTRLTDEMRARLVLENDEMCYNADDLLPVCEELDIPLVFDYHHNWIYPSEKPLPELIERINAIWHRKGVKPKQHLSEPCPGAETVMEKRKHADRCQSLPEHLPDDMDLMIEAKDKEQAVLLLHRIYNLQPVIHENLRPDKPPKPFPRASQGEGAGDEDGEGASQGSPGKRRTRAKAKAEKEAMEVAEVLELGMADEPKDLEDTSDLEGDRDVSQSPKKRKKSRKSSGKKAGQAKEVPQVVDVAKSETIVPGGDTDAVPESVVLSQKGE